MELIIMKTIFTILSIGLFVLLASSVQAAIINVTNETLYMNSEVTLEYMSGDTEIHRSSHHGSIFSGDLTIEGYYGVHYFPMAGWPGYYECASIVMNAAFEAYVGSLETTYWMELETDVYAMAWVLDPDPSKVIASAFDYVSLIEITMDFFVAGDDAKIRFDVFNEGTYGPVAFILDDLTTSTRLCDVNAAYFSDPSSAYTGLLDGHHYSMSLMVSEQYHEDEDQWARLTFAGSELVKIPVAEPPISLLLSAGLVGLGFARRSLRGRASAS
jgi:hypothetical protein